MLDGNYKNLKVSGSFADMLNEMTSQTQLTSELKNAAIVLREKINSTSYIDSRHRDILECFRSNSIEKDRYNQDMFRLFEDFISNNT